ncbi:MAG TPA: hypothetical protein VFZ40_16460 [Pyrinomonadaceae bacterium]
MLVLFLLVLAAPVVNSSQKRPPARVNSNEDNLQWETARKGIEKNGEHITSAMWALTHGYSSRARMDEAMRLLLVFLEAISKNDPEKLRPIGGLEGFFSRYLKLLRSDDDMVAGFSARVLAVTAGSRYEPQILALLQQRDASFTDEWAYPSKVARGNAAFALSINGSDKHKPQIAQLLKSMNEYDRSGAVHALGRLKAMEYAGEIAALLLRKEFTFRRSESPIYALVKMGVAAQFKKEIGQALEEDYDSEVQEAAAFALAHVRAIEYAPKIAGFLEDDYRRSWAAKVLALLGAKEFAPQIARIAFGADWLDRSAALLSLGILRAENYAPQISSLMKSKDLAVSYDAALSLALMGGAGYEKEILARLSTNKTGKYVDEGELHPLVAEEAREIDERVRAALQLFRSGKAPGS